MSQAKQSFVLYADVRKQVKKLSEQEAGRLFIALLDYAADGILPDLVGATDMCFAFIQASIDRDSVRWEEKRLKRIEAGRLGGLISGENRKQARADEANASITLSGEANEAVPVPIPVQVPVPAPDPASALFKQEKAVHKFVPPTVEEVRAYCKENKFAVDPGYFFRFYADADWTDTNGKAVRNWKQKLVQWASKEKERQAAATPTVRRKSDFEGSDYPEKR